VETYVIAGTGHPSTGGGRADHKAYRGSRHEAASLLLGYYMHSRVLRCTGAEDRGVKRSRFYVLREAPCPAALIECGFLSNPDEAAAVRDVRYRRELANGISEGILRYLAEAAKVQAALDTAGQPVHK
jgi:N-acetylmuramoyl-L-alanine amidase